ncbi:hypothetical protein [Coleofasciculus sp. FACHB-T130]|nr:hypothetical protein [Coleofasciculus sp. FACHB-T130]
MLGILNSRLTTIARQVSEHRYFDADLMLKINKAIASPFPSVA